MLAGQITKVITIGGAMTWPMEREDLISLPSIFCRVETKLGLSPRHPGVTVLHSCRLLTIMVKKAGTDLVLPICWGASGKSYWFILTVLEATKKFICLTVFTNQYVRVGITSMFLEMPVVRAAWVFKEKLIETAGLVFGSA